MCSSDLAGPVARYAALVFMSETWSTWAPSRLPSFELNEFVLLNTVMFQTHVALSAICCRPLNAYENPTWSNIERLPLEKEKS